MLSLLGSLMGFGTSFLPKVMDFFQDKQDKKHELAVMEVQIRQQKELASQKLEAINVEADIREIESLHKSMQPTGLSGLTVFVVLCALLLPMLSSGCSSSWKSPRIYLSLPPGYLD